ncbi:uncharacterized protein LOC143288023 isoform X2 [Babylonia areolata]|uniref:uncharacterized protein LOC143288023 isoform X2 n=1 Tax=Babylonia areolata TaxID=304850 RepID=UPI003FD321A2
MASLVADYGDSSGDSEEEENTGSIGLKREDAGITKEVSVNFFAEGDNDSSDDATADAESNSSSSKPEEKQQQQAENVPKLPNPFLQKTKLPSPHLKSKKKSQTLIPGPTSSVFVNPFEQAEQAKLGILEKHVRLTEAAPQKPATKQVCFKFKKGKCFLGDKCRFFHDRSNIALGAGSGSEGSGEAASPVAVQDEGPGFGRGDRSFKFPGFGGASGVNADGQFYHPAAQFSQGQPADPRTMDDDSYMAGAKGKKRHGITDSLMPPKKAMTDLGGLRKQERPWTVKK